VDDVPVTTTAIASDLFVPRSGEVDPSVSWQSLIAMRAEVMNRAHRSRLVAGIDGVRRCGEYGWPVADTRALFDVIRHVRDFTVTDEHLRLLRHAYVSWFDAEFGAPSIDPKRPYGNSNVYGDMVEVLGLVDVEWQDEAEEDWPPPGQNGASCGCMWRPRLCSRSRWPPASSAPAATCSPTPGAVTGSATRTDRTLVQHRAACQGGRGAPADTPR
jgi:hypothetical protein